MADSGYNRTKRGDDLVEQTVNDRSYIQRQLDGLYSDLTELKRYVLIDAPRRVGGPQPDGLGRPHERGNSDLGHMVGIERGGGDSARRRAPAAHSGP